MPTTNAHEPGPMAVGINRTQDGSLCVMQGSQLLCCIQKERLTRRKHDWGRCGDLRDVYLRAVPALGRPIEVLVECYSSDREFERLADYERELAETLVLAPGCRRARISHHLAHLYSVFPPSPFDEAAVMVVDGQGSRLDALTEDWPAGRGLPGHWREVASFYRVRRGGAVDCLDKQLWEGEGAGPAGLGMFYFLLTQAMFPGEGNEGKVMGLAPHGDPRALGLPPLEVEGCRVTIPAAWLELLALRPRFRYQAGEASRFADIANLAAAGQRAFEDALLRLAGWLHRRTGLQALCFAGGTGLNCSANDRLLREGPFEQVFIPPAPGDAGTALGCAAYGLGELLRQPCDWRWTHDFLGPEPSLAAIESALQPAYGLWVERPPDLPARMVELLADGRVLALYQGRSEFGPRALGHRSILADPRREGLRDWVNARVKEREWFRPLAPVVLLEQAGRFFDLRRPTPFMQFAAPVRPEAVASIPAVTHVDGTARLQTVGPRDDALLRTLLLAFAARTGVPVLLNTSFNRKDEPIVETPAQALETFRRTPLHALAMPPYLVRKHHGPAVVA